MSSIVKLSDRVLKIREKYTSQNFIKEYSPVALQKRFVELSLQQAISEKIARLSEVMQAYGYEAVLTYIHSWILQLDLFLNRKVPMSDAQLEEASLLFYQKGKQLNLAELTLFFNTVKMGDYGELIGYLDGPRLLSYLGQFIAKRDAEVTRLLRKAEREQVQSAIEKEKALFVPMPEEMKQRIFGCIGKVSEKTEQELKADNDGRVKRIKEKGFLA